jgi:hypothetical protein
LIKGRNAFNDLLSSSSSTFPSEIPLTSPSSLLSSPSLNESYIHNFTNPNVIGNENNVYFSFVKVIFSKIENFIEKKDGESYFSSNNLNIISSLFPTSYPNMRDTLILLFSDSSILYSLPRFFSFIYSLLNTDFDTKNTLYSFEKVPLKSISPSKFLFHTESIFIGRINIPPEFITLFTSAAVFPFPKPSLETPISPTSYSYSSLLFFMLILHTYTFHFSVLIITVLQISYVLYCVHYNFQFSSFFYKGISQKKQGSIQIPDHNKLISDKLTMFNSNAKFRIPIYISSLLSEEYVKVKRFLTFFFFLIFCF